MDFTRINAARNYDLPALRVVCGIDFGDCLRRSQLLVILIVVTNPYEFIVSNTKVNADNRTGVSTLKFSEPLVRNGKIADNGNGKDSARANTKRLAQSADSSPANKR
jgi:hypothetical protein